MQKSFITDWLFNDVGAWEIIRLNSNNLQESWDAFSNQKDEIYSFWVESGLIFHDVLKHFGII